MAAEYYWCRSCGRFSTLSEVARFGVGTYPYFCSNCTVTNADQTISPGKTDLRPWPHCEDENPELPSTPRVGEFYPASLVDE